MRRSALAAAGITLVALLVALSLGASPALAQGVGGVPPPAGVVSNVPASNTPHFPASTSPTEQIRQLAQCGGSMYAVGSFTTIKHGSNTYSRTDIFSFSATSPFTVTSWAPAVTGSTTVTDESGGDAINSIVLSSNCADAYIGGNFTKINGTSVSNIAEISTSTGDVVSGFAHDANKTLDTLAMAGSHLFAGGIFTSINGDTTDHYMVSLNPSTGASDGLLHLNISGNYQYPGVDPNSTRVYNQQISPDGSLDLVEGDFTSVGGLARQEAFILNISTGTVTGWNAPEFDTECATVEPYYVRSGAWTPNGADVIFGDTGYHVNGQSTHGPQHGPCDAALAFSSAPNAQSPLWINEIGCDSLYSAAADSAADYFAGHERFSMNPNACDTLGPGGYNAPGMMGVQPSTGDLYVTSSNTAYYTRGRGLGADDLLVTSAGLWIGSDNAFGTESCGAVNGLAGICFLPYS